MVFSSQFARHKTQFLLNGFRFQGFKPEDSSDENEKHKRSQSVPKKSKNQGSKKSKSVPKTKKRRRTTKLTSVRGKKITEKAALPTVASFFQKKKTSENLKNSNENADENADKIEAKEDRPKKVQKTHIEHKAEDPINEDTHVEMLAHKIFNFIILLK